MCVPQAAIVLNNALMEKIFQQLNLTLQSTHLLNTHTKKVQRFTRHNIKKVSTLQSLKKTVHLARFWTIWVKLNLFNSKFSAGVRIVA